MKANDFVMCGKADFECLRIKCLDLVAEIDALLQQSKNVVYSGTIKREQLDAFINGIFHLPTPGAGKDEAKPESEEETSSICKGFDTVARDLMNGKIEEYQLGKTITTEHKDIGTITWTIIGVNCEDLAAMCGRPHITVQAEYIQLYRPFSLPDWGFPEGNSCWNFSSIKEWLHNDFLEGFAEADRRAIASVQKRICVAPGCCHLEIDDVFLLSASEVGAHREDGSFYHNEGEMYPYYKRMLSSMRSAARRRRGISSECSKDDYWLRSANVDDAKDHAGVLCVDDDGNITVRAACKGAGVLPACVIAALDIK